MSAEFPPAPAIEADSFCQLLNSRGYRFVGKTSGFIDGDGGLMFDLVTPAGRVRVIVYLRECYPQLASAGDRYGDPHTAMGTHDDYAPHSHEVRPDHRGVRRHG